MAQRFILNGTSYHGAGAIQEIATEVKSRGFKKAFVCSDPDLVKFGVTAKVLKVLDDNGFSYELYSNIKPNPTIENVQTGVEAFKNAGTDYLIAIGGGSSMDTAKAIGIIINNPEFADVRSLEGVADTKNPAVPIIAVPTTAGTAAEVTINYVITDAEKNRKMVCVDPNDIPIVAIVDSELMASMPKSLAAATGMDALTHALEGYITKAHNEMSDMFHIKAIQLIVANLAAAVNEKDKKAINIMGMAQYIAGMGFSNVGLGICHSMAHQLGAVYDTPHGIANAMLLPTVLEFNGEVCYERYQDILKALGYPAEKYTKEEKKLVAYHEAGHAVLGIKLDNANDVQKVTIIPRGQAGGYNLMLPKEEKYTATKTELLEQIMGLLGGRVAEEVVFGEITTGAHNDFSKATKIARSMVTEYGMSSLGPVQLETPEGSSFLGRDYNKNRNFSDQVALEIDNEVRKIINDCYSKAKKIIEKNRDLLDLIASNLIEHETLTKEQIDYIAENGKMPVEEMLDDVNLSKLKEMAKAQGIKGYSSMNKDELKKALSNDLSEEEKKDD